MFSPIVICPGNSIHHRFQCGLIIDDGWMACSTDGDTAARDNRYLGMMLPASDTHTDDSHQSTEYEGENQGDA